MVVIRETTSLEDEVFAKITTILSDIIFISRKHSFLFCILFGLLVMFSMEKNEEENTTCI